MTSENKKYVVVSEAGSIDTGSCTHHSGDIDSRVTVYRVKAPEGWTETIVAVESRYCSTENKGEWDWRPEHIISVSPDARWSGVRIEMIADDNRAEAIVEAIEAYRQAAPAAVVA
jgi:hypothetical protein